MGVCMCQFWTGEQEPFPPAEFHPEEVHKWMSHPKVQARPLVPADMDERYKGIMARCWAHEPAQRPTAGQVAAELQALLAGFIQ